MRLPISSAHSASKYLLSSQWVAPEAITVLKDLQTYRLVFNLSHKQIPGVSLFLPTTNKKTVKHSTAARENDIVYKYFYLKTAFIIYYRILVGFLIPLAEMCLDINFLLSFLIKTYSRKTNYVATANSFMNRTTG